MDFINLVSKVKYEEKLSFDFDHKMVSMWLGKKQVCNRIRIFNNTLEHILAEKVGIISIYDCINNHLLIGSENLARYIGNFMWLFREYYDVEEAMYSSVDPTVARHRLEVLLQIMDAEFLDLPNLDVLLELDFTCDFKNLYESIANNLKLVLLELQNRQKKLSQLKREVLLNKVHRMERNFGISSEQFLNCFRDFLSFLKVLRQYRYYFWILGLLQF